MPFKANVSTTDSDDDDYDDLEIPQTSQTKKSGVNQGGNQIYVQDNRNAKTLPILSVDQLQWGTGTHMMLLGMTGSGKSVFIRQIYERHVGKGKRFDFALLFGFNADRPQYDYIDKKQRFTEVNPESIKQKWNAMRKLRDRYAQTYGQAVADRFETLFIFDDILGENFHKDKFYADFISRCRHDGIVCIFGIQYINSIPPVIRNNVSQFIITCGTNQIAQALYPMTKETNLYRFMDVVNKVKMGKPLYIDIRPHLADGTPRLAYIDVPSPNGKPAVKKTKPALTESDKEIAREAISNAAAEAAVDAAESTDGVIVAEEALCAIL